MPKKLFLLGLIFLMSCGLLSAQYETSPSSAKFIPEAVYAPATGGGVWRTEVQVESRDDNLTALYVYLFYGGGNYQYVNIPVNMDIWDVWKTSNILYTMDIYDSSGFDYYPRVGAVGIYTLSGSKRIVLNARTYHTSGYSKSFNGFEIHDGQLCRTNHHMEILNVQSNSTYRCAMSLFNPTSSNVSVTIFVMQSGSSYSSTVFNLGPYDFAAFYPFDEVGWTGNYNSAHIYVHHESGNGKVMCLAALVHNATNDPSARVGTSFYVVE
jgi:hypothetical protein